MPVIAGAGSNSTKEAVELAEHAEKAGANAVLVVTPYYNKPTQEGMYQHFKAINDAIGIPIIIYNIPPRSVIDMSVDTMTRLFELKNIAGVKDATASMVRVSQQRARDGRGLQPALGRGRHHPRLHGPWRPWLHLGHVERRAAAVRGIPCAWQKGDVATALKLHDKLMPLHTNLFIETNPAPVKYAMSLLGKMDEKLRLPMVPVSEPTRGGAQRHGACRPDQLSLVDAADFSCREAEEKGLRMLKEFREFAMKGNVVDLAVGVIIGAAFGAIVTSLVGDVIMPIIGAITGGLDFSNYFTRLSKAVTATNLADAKKQGAVLAWGSFLTLTLNFMIVAFVLFIVIRAMNQLKRKEEAAPAAPPKPTRQEELLTEIRDLLKKS